MRHIIFQTNPTGTYKAAILIKESAFNNKDLEDNYVACLQGLNVDKQDLIAFTLKFDGAKPSSKCIKEYLSKLLPALESIGVTHLYVTDSSYFKVLAGQSKAEPSLGYVLPCKAKGHESMSVVLGLNYQALIYNPSLQAKLELSLKTLASDMSGSYQSLGSSVIHSEIYPKTVLEIAQALQELHQHPVLTCDIEAFSLSFNMAGIGTIAFAWNQHEGIAFAVDAKPLPYVSENHHAFKGKDAEIRVELKQFFETYQGELIFHNCTYDVKVLIAQLWMEDLLDTKGLLTGLEIMTRKMHDTKIVAYLATNSTAGNSLSLKALAHEFAGNWAVEVSDIRRVPLDDLLRYNLIDALSTFYVWNKYYPIMVADNQEHLYKSLMMPSQKLLIQTELTGMPMCPYALKKTKHSLERTQDKCIQTIENHSTIKMLNLLLQQHEMEKANAKLKTKQHPLSKFADTTFNPNSGPQLQRLLYEVMGLPVLDYTDKKQPATGADTIEKLVNHTSDEDDKALLNALIAYGKVTKILSTFIPAFENGIEKADEMLWLHGSFNLGGTVSGRLSSSDPNMQNLPAGSDYGKTIKKIFQAPDGWIFAGADFNSLEDYISALTTKDPNKLNVYIKGFDGHCLRAAYYFREELGHIDLDDPKSVNSIKKTHPELRQESKAPTFALTYQGTAHTLMTNLGWSEEKAKRIEANYHELYKVSDQYVQDRLKQASVDGYVEVAFGLRVRTPLLKQVVFGSKTMPREAAAEGRTAGNALGQSYGLLNNRAAVDFMQKVWASPYRLCIKPVALIHDAIYLVILDDVRVVEWANRELINSMRWQELKEIQHPTVKLGAALDLFWPSWANAITLPNEASQEEIRKLCEEAKKDQ